MNVDMTRGPVIPDFCWRAMPLGGLAFLASPDAAWITGEVVRVSGGKR